MYRARVIEDLWDAFDSPNIHNKKGALNRFADSLYRGDLDEQQLIGALSCLADLLNSSPRGCSTKFLICLAGETICSYGELEHCREDFPNLDRISLRSQAMRRLLEQFRSTSSFGAVINQWSSRAPRPVDDEPSEHPILGGEG